jgi:hypothetical protein
MEEGRIRKEVLSACTQAVPWDTLLNNGFLSELGGSGDYRIVSIIQYKKQKTTDYPTPSNGKST